MIPWPNVFVLTLAMVMLSPTRVIVSMGVYLQRRFLSNIVGEAAVGNKLGGGKVEEDGQGEG